MTAPATRTEPDVFGSGGRIGCIAPSTCERLAREFYQFAPPDVGLLIASLSIAKLSPDHVEVALGQIEQAARQLADTGAEAVFAAGLPLVVDRGIAFDAELCRRLEAASGLPSITDLSAALAALRALDLDDVILVTPFTDTLTRKVADALTEAGVHVRGQLAMGYDRQLQYGLLPDTAPRDAVRELLTQHPAAPGIYVPCGRIGNVGHITNWEREFGRPVVTANQLAIWWLLRQAGAAPVSTDGGALLNLLGHQPPGSP